MAKQLIYQFDINGTTRTLNFGMLAWDIFCEEMDISLLHSMECFARPRKDEAGNPAIDAEGNIQYEPSPQVGKASRMICYAGIVCNDRLNGIPDSVTLAEVNSLYNDDPDMIADIAAVAIDLRLEKVRDKLDAQKEKAAAEAPPSKKKASRSMKSKK